MTIPTQRPPSLTTGRPGSSCSTQEPHDRLDVVVRRHPQDRQFHDVAYRRHGRGRLPGTAERLDDVAGDDAVGARRCGRRRAGVQVRADAGARGRERLQALGEQRADDARQHVAGAGRRERGRAAGLTATRPSGPATSVSSPLSTTIAPARARPRGRGPGGGAITSPASTPSSRASSPPCGVRTVGRRDAASRSSRPRARSGRRRRASTGTSRLARPARARTRAAPSARRGPGRARVRRRALGRLQDALAPASASARRRRRAAGASSPRAGAARRSRFSDAARST